MIFLIERHGYLLVLASRSGGIRFRSRYLMTLWTFDMCTICYCGFDEFRVVTIDENRPPPSLILLFFLVCQLYPPSILLLSVPYPGIFRVEPRELLILPTRRMTPVNFPCQ